MAAALGTSRLDDYDVTRLCGVALLRNTRESPVE
jgi:hypothetical protein